MRWSKTRKDALRKLNDDAIAEQALYANMLGATPEETHTRVLNKIEACHKAVEATGCMVKILGLDEPEQIEIEVEV